MSDSAGAIKGKWMGSSDNEIAVDEHSAASYIRRFDGGADGTRTRDLLRDRQTF